MNLVRLRPAKGWVRGKLGDLLLHGSIACRIAVRIGRGRPPGLTEVWKAIKD